MAASTPAFKLKRFDVTTHGSISAVLATERSLCGLYVLRFADGQAYVGQSTNVVSRFLSHRRRWDDIVAVEFTPWARRDLDEGELRLIQLVEATAPLRNKLGAGRPGGEDDAVVEVEDVRHAVLPWARDERKTVTTADIDSRRQRFWELRLHPDYELLRAVVATYLRETVPDPANTQQYYWNVTALPETARTKTGRRLMTLNCGRIETLFISEIKIDGTNDYGLNIRVNVSIPEGATDADLDGHGDDWWSGRSPSYSQPTWSWLASPERLMDLLADSRFADQAYEYNVRQMRRGRSPYQQYHNVELATDLLATAFEQEAEAPTASLAPISTVAGASTSGP